MGAGVLAVVLLAPCARPPDDRESVPRSLCYRLSVVEEVDKSKWAARFPMILELTAVPADSAVEKTDGEQALRSYTWEDSKRSRYPFAIWTPRGSDDSLVAAPEYAYAGIRLRARRQNGHMTGRIVPFSDVVAPGDMAGAGPRAFAVRGESVSCPSSGD